MAELRRIKLTIEYDGTHYAGWQIQPNANTIQAEIETALFRVTGEKIRIHGAGRTDAGVHALAQTAHFDTHSRVPETGFAPALNTHLPPDIRIKVSEGVADSFHARFSAKGKTYSYCIHNSNVAPAIFRHTTCSIKKPLDIAAMQDGARFFVGEHDFTAFCALGTTVEDKVRKIQSIQVTADAPLITITVQGNGFLYNMVRIMVGTLVDVGRGKLKPSDIKAILQSKDRQNASATLPPQGLVLKEVAY